MAKCEAISEAERSSSQTSRRISRRRGSVMIDTACDGGAVAGHHLCHGCLVGAVAFDRRLERAHGRLLLVPEPGKHPALALVANR
jgi:hypothetical protein